MRRKGPVGNLSKNNDMCLRQVGLRSLFFTTCNTGPLLLLLAWSNSLEPLILIYFGPESGRFKLPSLSLIYCFRYPDGGRLTDRSGQGWVLPVAHGEGGRGLANAQASHRVYVHAAALLHSVHFHQFLISCSNKAKNQQH